MPLRCTSTLTRGIAVLFAYWPKDFKGDRWVCPPDRFMPRSNVRNTNLTEEKRFIRWKKSLVLFQEGGGKRAGSLFRSLESAIRKGCWNWSVETTATKPDWEL